MESRHDSFSRAAGSEASGQRVMTPVSEHSLCAEVLWQQNYDAHGIAGERLPSFLSGTSADGSR
jgi:hypothetical protein